MTAERISVGVFSLDQVLLPDTLRASGWPARLAAAAPVLEQRARPVPLIRAGVAEEGLAVAEPALLGRTALPEGARVQVEPVPGRAGLFLVRCGGKPVAVASAMPWAAGESLPKGATLPAEAPAAFAAGTLIDTPDGPRAAGSLAAGEVVTTLSNGSRPLRWVGRRRVSAIEFLAHPELRPVALAPGALGNTDRALVVSATKRLLIDDWRAEVYFGEDRVLVSAGALVDDVSARRVLPEAGVEYVALLCDRHEVLLADGALAESFHPGETGLAGLDPGARATLAKVVPEAELVRRRAACPIVQGAEARALRLQG